MKRCLLCGITNASVDWVCSACGSEPKVVDGLLAFAPALASANDGMDPNLHNALDVLQDRSFWFRARNRLIVDLATRFFPYVNRVLEIGCGTGYVLKGLQSALPNSKFSGSEIYVNALQYARRRLGDQVDLYQMDARAIPFRGEFDLICAFDVLEHIEEDEAVLTEMRQALRPGGGLLLSVPQHPALWSQFDEIGCHKRRYEIGELGDKCERAGFTIVRSTSFVTTLLPAMFMQRFMARRRSSYKATEEFSLPIWLDRFFEQILDVERKAIQIGLTMPVGGSRFVVARMSTE